MKKEQKNFLWGVVNIGAQTEGGQVYSDWSRWSCRGQVSEMGVANNYWNQFEGYHEIAYSIGCNAFRTTIEWSRIELREGEFDENAVEHYKKILQDMKENDMVTVVGLWHWSVPAWFEDSYGIHKKEGIKKFQRFARYICDELGDVIDQIVILNEPNVFVSTSYVAGEHPPFFKDRVKAFFAKKNLIEIHRDVYCIWKERYPDVLIGSTFLWNHEYGAENTLLQKTYIFIKQYFWVRWWIKKILKCSDYIGINYYTSDGVFFGKSSGRCGVHGTNDWHDPDVWKIFPEGLYHVLMQVKKYDKPVYILENGKPSVFGVDDDDRQEFLTKTIAYMKKAMDDEVDVRGYFHYSLCDSYEWNSGYDFKFGLVEIDRTGLICTKRKSCQTYARIIDDNKIML